MEDPLDIYQDVIDISSDDEEITEADNYPQKEEMTDREWRSELDDIRAEIDHESYAREDAINPYAKLNTDTTPFLEEEDRFRNDRDFNNPALEVEDDDEEEDEIIMSLPAVEDFGQFTVPKNPDLVTSQYPTDQEGFARANWDDATIEDRKNWLSVNGFDTDEAWSPYYSLDTYVRANLVKDLEIGGIYAMGTGSLY